MLKKIIITLESFLTNKLLRWPATICIICTFKILLVALVVVIMFSMASGAKEFISFIVDENNAPSIVMSNNIKYTEMLNVVVRLESSSDKGSGVLIYRQKMMQDHKYVYYVITGQHVVSSRIVTSLQINGIRGIYKTIETDPGIVIRVFYNSATEWTEYDGEVIVESPTSDLALVKFETDDYLSDIARLADSEMISEIEIFDEIYAIGCQLGYQVIPTRGIIAGFTEYDDLTILFHTAPTLPGSSGGGLFKKDDGQYYLIGLPQGVGRHRYHIIPHYGYAISAEMIYRFLHENDMSFIYESKMNNEV